MSETVKELEQHVMDHIKEAWCIDGEVEAYGDSIVTILKTGIKTGKSRTYKLTDSKRGEFFLTLSSQKLSNT